MTVANNEDQRTYLTFCVNWFYILDQVVWIWYELSLSHFDFGQSKIVVSKALPDTEEVGKNLKCCWSALTMLSDVK